VKNKASLNLLLSVAILATLLCFSAISAVAQPLAIGAKTAVVDSFLAKWTVLPSSSDPGDSVCLGAKLWDHEGHLIFHIDSTEHTLTKVDWSSYMPVSRDSVEEVAKLLDTTLGPCDRARNDQWIYWIWDNEAIHYLLGYGAGTMRLQEFEDQTALEACTLPH
jgi:hypothetical protein